MDYFLTEDNEAPLDFRHQRQKQGWFGSLV
jgi:hypothetical protein